MMKFVMMIARLLAARREVRALRKRCKSLEAKSERKSIRIEKLETMLSAESQAVSGWQSVSCQHEDTIESLRREIDRLSVAIESAERRSIDDAARADKAEAELSVANAENKSLWKMHERTLARLDRERAIEVRGQVQAENDAATLAGQPENNSENF